MPIYEYACRDCGQEFEALVRAKTQPQCPACRSTQLEKQLSVFATTQVEAPATSSPCSACGDPRGPGACRLN